MKTKDLVYVGIIAFLAYLLLKKKPLTQDGTTTVNNPPVGNSTNGGLNLGSNMDLPNLTPTPPNGLPTEVALNNSNVTPLIKDDNEPTQVFGNYNLPTPYTSGSIISPNPIDVLPVSTSPYPTASTTTQPTVSTSAFPTASTIEFETVGNPIITSGTSVVAEPIYNTPRPTPTNNSQAVEQEPLPIYNTPRPVVAGSSAIAEPAYEVKNTRALPLEEPILGSANPIIPESVKQELISQCGNSFSIPNNDKEGSYTNYWFDGETYFMQTTSPFMKTVATKITKDLFVDGCKRLQSYQLQNNKL